MVLVSAPGKILLFGEHAVVHGRAAVAAAIDLRSFLLVSPGADGTVALQFPNVGLYESWPIADLPWDVVKHSDRLSPPADLDPEIVEALQNPLSKIESHVGRAAAFAFLYIYLHIAKQDDAGSTFTLRSALPIGSGLGSSASFSVCLSTAILLQGNYIRATPLEQSIRIIEAWAFLGEKCIHGNPSGVDNAIATLGGSVLFRRAKDEFPAVKAFMRDFPKLRVLVTDTKQPRQTSELVAKVGALLKTYPVMGGRIIDAIDEVSQTAHRLLRTAVEDGARADWVNQIGEMVRINHGLLTALGVSHEKLERVKQAADLHGIGWTKLTGAGGGGCAFTVIRDSVDEGNVKMVKDEMERLGFSTFETTLGADGVSVHVDGHKISPHHLHGENADLTLTELGKPDGWIYL